MFKQCIDMEILRNVVNWGNGAGVLLPREWAGGQVKVTLINRTLEIKKEVLSILAPYLEDIIGIYLVGSYARGEQEKESDVDVIAISENTKKEIVSGKYHISLVPVESALKTIEKNPLMILPRLKEAKVIMNSFLLNELASKKVKKSSFKDFAEECERVVKINRGLMDLGKGIDPEVVYSLILRLRGVFLAKSLIKEDKYSKKEFLRWIGNGISQEEIVKIYNIYRSFKDNKKTKVQVKIEDAEKLIELLEKEAKNLKNE